MKTLSKAQKAKRLKELKSVTKLLEKVLNTPYSYKNNSKKLSYDEEVLIELTCGNLEGKDGEISKQLLQSVWNKIKDKMKKDLQNGNHNNKLLQMTFQWNIRQKHFAELLVKETGLFKRLIEMYRRRFGMMPTKDEAELMVETCLKKFTEY